jgi:hypothetical protein
MQNAAVPVRRVFAETDVGCDVEVGETRSKHLDGGDDGPFRVVGEGAGLVLERRLSALALAVEGVC